MSFKVEVEVHGEEGSWHSNAIRLATQDEALKYGADLFSRWMMVVQYRVAEDAEPVNYEWRNGGLEKVPTPDEVQDQQERREQSRDRF